MAHVYNRCANGCFTVLIFYYQSWLSCTAITGVPLLLISCLIQVNKNKLLNLNKQHFTCSALQKIAAEFVIRFKFVKLIKFVIYSQIHVVWNCDTKYFSFQFSSLFVLGIRKEIAISIPHMKIICIGIHRIFFYNWTPFEEKKSFWG